MPKSVDYRKRAADSAVEYRRKAEECVAQAEIINDQQQRAALLTVARSYARLADRIGESRDAAVFKKVRARSSPAGGK